MKWKSCLALKWFPQKKVTIICFLERIWKLKHFNLVLVFKGIVFKQLLKYYRLQKIQKTYNLQTVLRLRYFIAQLCLTRLLINDSGVRFWRCLSSSFRIQVVIDINTCHLFVLVPVTKKHPVDGKSCSNIPQTCFVW